MGSKVSGLYGPAYCSLGRVFWGWPGSIRWRTHRKEQLGKSLWNRAEYRIPIECEEWSKGNSIKTRKNYRYIVRIKNGNKQVEVFWKNKRYHETLIENEVTHCIWCNSFCY